MENIILSKSETSFKLEGRDTNLLVFTDDDFIYMRIDCFKQFNVPLTKENVKRLINENAKGLIMEYQVINDLLKLGEFKYPKTQQDEIISLLSKLEQRKCREW